MESTSRVPGINSAPLDPMVPLWGADSAPSSSGGRLEFLGAVRVARMRGVGNAVPGQRLSQRVFERRWLEAEVAPRPSDVVAGVAPRVGPVWAGSLRKLGERDWVDPRLHTQGACDAFDQIAQADVFERRVVCLVRRLLAQVARERAGEPDVLHPREVGGALIRFFRDEKRTAVGDTLDVRGDAQTGITRAEHRRRPHHGPRQVAVVGEQGLAPALAVEVLERGRRLAVQRHEVFFARGLAMKGRIHACRDKYISLAFELPSHRFDVTGLIAREVEQHVGFCLCQRSCELAFIGTVECDVAREDSIRPLLPARSDGFDAAAHELLAGGDADEPGATEYESARQSMSRVTKSTSTPSISRSRSASSPARTTDRCLPPVHPNATTMCMRPFSWYSGSRSRTILCTSSSR